MVKYNKKFFFNVNDTSSNKTPKRRSKKNESNASLGLFAEKFKYFFRKLLPFIGLLVLILLIIIYVKGCSDNQKKRQEVKDKQKQNETLEPKIIDTININLNDTVPGIDRFVRNYSKIKTDTDTITYEETNFVDSKYDSVGEYKVIINLNGKEYTSRIIVSDKEAPTLALKEVIITEGEFYAINDFISSCSDNSGKDCAFNYADEQYGKYTAPGTYDISIIASDLSGNKTDAQSTKLTIKAKETPSNGGSGKKSGGSTNTGCQYGDATSPVSTPLTYSLVKNGCAIDPAYAKTSTYITIPESMGRTDLAKLKDDFTRSGISAEIQTEFNVIPIFNTTGKGLIGYQVEIIASNNKTKEVLEHYYLNSNKTRTYVVNKLNFK